jgi:hypothetical protein
MYSVITSYCSYLYPTPSYRITNGWIGVETQSSATTIPLPTIKSGPGGDPRAGRTTLQIRDSSIIMQDSALLPRSDADSRVRDDFLRMGQS